MSGPDRDRAGRPSGGRPSVRAWTPDRATAIGTRLAERARLSAEAHRGFSTVRREELRWLAAGPGTQAALLNQRDDARTRLLRLETGAALPWADEVFAQEVLVVAGGLRAIACDADPVALPPTSYALRSAASAGRLEACAPTTVYLREMLTDPTRLAEPEGAWWRMPRRALEVVPAGRRRWQPTFPGVQVMPLWGNPAVTSMLVRFDAGAGVPDHHHDAHEDCLMLDGEMFLGDILLRPGDYQFAPAGSGHFGETSDVGGTFFFHGALDPVLTPGSTSGSTSGSTPESAADASA